MAAAGLLFGVLFFLMFIGVPVVFSILLSCIFFLLTTGLSSLVLVPQRIMVGLDSFPLLAAPLFILAGELMSHSSISKRLAEVVIVGFGRFRGGMGVVTIVACTIFAALSGSGPATVAAIGAVMFTALMEEGYTRGSAAGLIAAGGALGPIIPPSICMIVYATTMNQSVTYMFAGSIIPGLLISSSLLLVNAFMAKKWNLQMPERHYTFKEGMYLLWRSLGVLFLPVLVLGGIYGGICTPTEAAVLACVYSAILGFIYKDLTIKSVVKIVQNAAAASSVLSVVIGAAGLLGWILAKTRIPIILTEAFIRVVPSAAMYLLIFTILLFIVGAIMYNIPAIVILAPVLIPVGVALGIDPLHLGIVFCINLIIGFVTPPFGINLFAACAATGESYSSVVKGVVPFMIVEMVMVITLTFLPQITLLVPRLLYGYGM